MTARRDVGSSSQAAAFQVSSPALYSATTGLLLVMNKIQPSQLAEEQRNAARLFHQLYSQIQTTLNMGNPSPSEAERIMEKILALDKAYLLPLMPEMLEKFPKKVEPYACGRLYCNNLHGILRRRQPTRILTDGSTISKKN
ncbi:hypothetical protein H6P81_002754 [Aristolochia fimbriata]|uniref:Uncharacterized protein n=1 Tax=Aristolochia fimbriata TaxID=158543 RepID=A0AAV7FDU9_ARIFI|nr:hypothetical protein H6P81_002754 [Aristolochia fimbriata]